MSAPLVIALTSNGAIEGGCCRSPSMTTTMSSVRVSSTSATARARPRRSWLWWIEMDVSTAIKFSISRVVPSVLSSANTTRYGMVSNATANWATSGGGLPRSLNVGTIRAIDGADPGFMDSWDPSANVRSIERLASVLTLAYLYID